LNFKPTFLNSVYIVIATLFFVALTVGAASTHGAKSAENYFVVVDKKSTGYDVSITNRQFSDTSSRWSIPKFMTSIPVNGTLRKFSVEVETNNFIMYWSIYSVFENKYIDFSCSVELNEFCKPKQFNEVRAMNYYVDISSAQNITQELCDDYKSIVKLHEPQQQILWKSELGLILIHDANVMRSCNAR